MEEYTFHEYPRAVYRQGKHDGIPGWVPELPYLMKTVNSADEELAAMEEGWSTTPPEAKKAKAAA